MAILELDLSLLITNFFWTNNYPLFHLKYTNPKTYSIPKTEERAQPAHNNLNTAFQRYPNQPAQEGNINYSRPKFPIPIL